MFSSVSCILWTCAEAFSLSTNNSGKYFPELFVDKEKASAQVQSMQDTEENIERIQTQIDMIRQESRLLSYRIDRMIEQRKELQDEKRNLKDLLINYKNP